MQKSAESAKRSHYFFLAGSRKTRTFLMFLLFYTPRRCGVHSMEIPARMRRPGAIRPGRYLRPSLGGYPNCFLYTRLK